MQSPRKVRRVTDERRGPTADAETLGVELAEAILTAGGKEILERAYAAQ